MLVRVLAGLAGLYLAAHGLYDLTMVLTSGTMFGEARVGAGELLTWPKDATSIVLRLGFDIVAGGSCAFWALRGGEN